MKQLRTSLYSLLAAVLLFTACSKDKGNYSYNLPEEPVITNLDTVYNVFVGDSLVIKPVITTKTKANFTLAWKISIPAELRQLDFQGPALRTIFGLGPERYPARLTITNTDNGMKYFRDFVVSGKTAFSTGTVVLSSENGKTQLSFIKPDGTVQARVYEAINGEALPADPIQLIGLVRPYFPVVTFRSYWVLGKSGVHTGVQMDANTFKKKAYLADNYFDAPDGVLLPSKMFTSSAGILSGVINGVLQSGTTSTWSEAPTYGMFGLGAQGDYVLSPEVMFDFNGGGSAYVGFDKNRKQFVRFNTYGDAIYFGTAYGVDGSAFNPMSVGMDLEHLQSINGKKGYAYCRASDNTLYELSFEAQFSTTMLFKPLTKRVFAQPSLINADTKWASTANEIIYFTAGDKIYRYNPLNQDFRTLTTDFGGKPVTMIKVIDSDNTLLAGTEGSLYYLDISAGKFGDLKSKVDGLPGKLIDVEIRYQ
jgi:hypothetical protein